MWVTPTKTNSTIYKRSPLPTISYTTYLVRSGLIAWRWRPNFMTSSGLNSAEVVLWIKDKDNSINFDQVQQLNHIWSTQRTTNLSIYHHYHLLTLFYACSRSHIFQLMTDHCPKHSIITNNFTTFSNVQQPQSFDTACAQIHPAFWGEVWSHNSKSLG